ncbi:hypothetical protein L873DRAFT_1789051 [Choiromyces venosus 120613-1]|uniref:Uncharacterized protein n=1 Tax=Choiromyces venosus 120613-1 TaxID=1336337 RepID=A0A3N4JPR5_9PEZI|nr:hypothetical protein L873DRAFT_1789051 [Choiromyces venosus 120613-1]
MSRLSVFKDPDVFHAIDKLELIRAILTLLDSDLTVVTHEGMSNLIIAQLAPCDPPLLACKPHPIEFLDVNSTEITMTLTRSPGSTLPGIDMIPYSFLRHLHN